ncbi:aminodeoxychorismate synthase component I [Arthrobacter cheniae]|uniref:aminodeoxychorismate synthase n=2 Tax=Arthrobacter cheniae TaxID=1258888 RepID=A0A3A5M6B6_9MICC|nr:aminodeoxychorismate synthase component I [Arthrobacter cheniae]
MIHPGHTCNPVEPVVVSVEHMETREGQAFVSMLVQVLNSVCTARTHTDWDADRDLPHAPGECPDVVLITGRGTSGHCMLRVLPGPQDSRFGAPTEISVLDLSHPEAPLHAADALAQLPALAAVRGFGQLSAPPSLSRVSLEAYPDPEAVFHEFYGLSSHRVWLDSSNSATDPVAGRNRYSIMADDSGTRGMRAQHANGVTTVESKLVVTRISGPFFSWLERNWYSNPAPDPDLPSGLEFALGWLGYLGYELKRECGGNAVESPLPDASLIRCSRAVVFDHEARCVFLLAEAGAEGRRWCSDAALRIGRLPSAARRLSSGLPVVQFSGADSGQSYLRKIAACQDEIVQGNSYEVCLTTQIFDDLHESLDPWDFYRRLRRASPAPFASFVQLGTVAIASSSPERFLSITADGQVRAEPIKGTRRRDASPESDRQLKHELRTSTKDRAENIMIVDLMRNDLSRHAQPGTVSVTRLCDVETYTTAHQLVSTIEAKIARDRSRAAVVAAAYPPGSMTGAPKISSMDILDRLESRPRGPYSGVVGYFSPTGAADLAVTIRSAVFSTHSTDGQRLSVGIGGAITADSDPDDELAEIHTKATAILRVFGAPFPISAHAGRVRARATVPP